MLIEMNSFRYFIAIVFESFLDEQIGAMYATWTIKSAEKVRFIFVQ